MAKAKKVWTDEEKKEFAAKRKEKTDAATELLKTGINEMFNSDRYAEFLKFYSDFHKYSFGNMILIKMQLPIATRCASCADWNKKGRRIKKGEHGLMVRVPTPKTIKDINKETGDEEDRTIMRYKIKCTYDISQTEGDPLPEICNKLTGDVDQFNKVYNSIVAVAKVPVVKETIDNGANGYYSIAENRIAIKDGMSQAQTIKTLCHEIAHSILHCKGGVMKKADKNTAELQAESVAFIVCNYLGIDTSEYSFGYVAGWSQDKSMKQLEKNITVIGKTAMEIISKIEQE